MSPRRRPRFSRRTLWLTSLAALFASLALEVISLRRQISATVLWNTDHTAASDLFSQAEIGFGRGTLTALQREPHESILVYPINWPRVTGTHITKLPLAFPAEHWPPIRVKRLEVSIALWMPLLLSLIGTILFFPRKTNQHPACPCGYPLTGLTVASCPECGNALPGTEIRATSQPHHSTKPHAASPENEP